MAARFNRNSGEESINLRNVMDNPQNEHITKDLFDILQAAHPNVQGEDILVAEESAINQGAGTGLLQELNKKNGLDFGFFGHENFSLEELGTLNLNKIPGLETSDDMRACIENAIVVAIKSEFSHGLDNAIARKFNDTVKYHNTTLAELLTTINLFDRQLNGEEKSKYLKFRNNFVLTFFQIRNNLAAINDPSTNQNINENLSSKPFSEWTESQQKGFDYLFSKLVLGRLKSRVQWVDSVAENITSSFSLPLSLSMIPRSQSFGLGEDGYQNLSEYARDNLPELYEALTQAAPEELEEIYWKIYLNKIEQTDPEIAEVLGYLYENDFDVACLNNDVVKRNSFLSKLASLRLQEMQESGAVEAFGNNTEQFKQFFMDLFDFSKNEITVNGVTLHVEKELGGSGANPAFKDFTELLNAKDLPIKFSIKGIENLNLSMEDQELFNKLFQGDFIESTETGQNGAPDIKHKDVVLENSKIGKLLILYLMGNPSTIESYNPNSEQGKKLDSFFKSLDKEIALDKSKRALNETRGENGENGEPSTEEILNEDEEKSDKEEILSLWNKIRGDQPKEGEDGFGHGALLYWPWGKSVLPPENADSNEYMKLYIKDVDWNRGTIKLRSNGVELELPGDYENKDIEMPLSVFKHNFLEQAPEIGGVPFKILSPKKDFKEAFDSFVDEKLGNGAMLGEAQIEGDKLMIRNRGMDGKEHHEEVKYLSSGLNVPDKDKVVYKIDWNGDGTVTVKSSSFLDGDKSTDYKRKMSYPDFLMFWSEKGLTPRTERMAEDEKTKIKDIVSHTTSKLKWVSIGSLIYSFKNIWKTLNDGIDNYNKKQNEECLNLIVGKGIFDKINKWFGWASPALSDAALQAQDKAEKGMDKAVWEGIDNWLKELSSMADYANFFEKGTDAPSGQKIRMLNKILKANGFNTIKEVVSSGTFVGENNQLRPIIAAAMIANIKKGAGLYRGLAEQDNQCLWIRCLLGPDHYKRYLQMRKQLENDIRQAEAAGDGGKAKQLSDLLVQSETTYIINCIENSHGKDQYFGAPSDNNVQALKLMYSNEFASQLASAVDEGIGEGAVDKGYSGTKKYNLFDPVFKEVEKNITSGRIDRGIGNIERLGEVAVNDSDFVNLNVAMTFVTLTGILNRKEGKSVRTRFDGLARAYMLPTAFFGEKNENQANAWYILEKSNCGFTEFMASKGLSKEQFFSSSDKVPYKQLFGALKEWWMSNSTQIDRYFESLKTTEQPDPILKKVRKILWEQNPDSISPKWRGKPKITGHYALLASPESIRQNKGYDKDGFSGETDERNDKAAFWESLLKSLNNAKKMSDVSPEFFLKEFKLLFNYEGFGTGNDDENNRMIQMIKEVKQRAGQPLTFNIPDNGGEQTISINAKYGPEDYKHLIWYMFKGRVLSSGRSVPPKEIDAVLDSFVSYFTEHFDEIAGNQSLLNDVFPVREILPIRKLVPWSEYQSVTWGDNNYGDLFNTGDEDDINSPDEPKRRKALKNFKKKHYKNSNEFYNEDFVSIQKNLKRLGVPAKTLSNIAGERGVTFG